MLCGCAWKSFCGSVVRSLSPCHTSPMLLPRSLWRLVLLLHGRRVLWRGRRPCESLPERLFAFDTKGGRTVLFACRALLIDKTACTPWLQHTKSFLYPSALGCRWVNVSPFGVDNVVFTAMTDVRTGRRAKALSDDVLSHGWEVAQAAGVVQLACQH